MVAIVSGNTLGLELGSLATLRQQGGAFGVAQEGRGGVAAYVNVANGNLVLQSRDEFLAARGADLASIRTYNSQGAFEAGSSASWTQTGFVQPLKLTGALNTAGSTLARTGRDGSVGIYRFDAARSLYVTSDGEGADDTLAFLAAEQQFEWRDGAGDLVQRYEGAGSYRLLSSRDASGNALSYQYNAAGQLSAATSASGDTTFYDYTGASLTQIRVVTAEGGTLTRTRYTHDASGRLVEVTLDLTPEDNSIADGRLWRTRYSYDGASQRIAQLTQSNGSRLDIAYAQTGANEWRVASIANALGETTRLTYSLKPGAPGFATVTDALGLVTRFDLDAAGQLVRVTSPGAAGAAPTRQFAYNARGDVIRVTDGQGRGVSYEHDASGNRILERDDAGNTVRRSFDARGRLLTHTVHLQPDADGAGPLPPGEPRTTRQVWDSAGRGLLRFVITPEGEVTEHRYNGFGERTSTITWLGGRFSTAGLATDAVPTEAQLLAWLATQNLAAAQREDIAYDARGQLQSRTTYMRLDAGGAGVADGTQATETFVHDAFGRLLQTISPTGGATSYVHDGLGRVIATTDALGRLTATQYDDANRRTTVTQAGGLVTTQVHDAAGRLVASIASAAGAGAGATLGETRYRWDAAGRLRMTQDPTGVRQWTFHDDAGRVVAEVDGNGTLTEYSFDRAGLLTRTLVRGTAIDTAALMDATGAPITTAALQALRPADSADDLATWNAYDALGRLRDVADARVHLTLRYDSVGNRTHIATRVAYQGTDGEAVSTSERHFQYDAMNRQTVVDAVDTAGNLGTQGHRITYDRSGNRTSDTFWGNRVSASNPVVGLDESGANVYASEPTYTASVGLVTEQYRYDALSRLTSVVRDGTLIDQRFYDGADRVIQSGPDGRLPTGFSRALNQGVAAGDINGVDTRVNRYDANGRLQHQRVFDSAGTLKADIRYDASQRVTVSGQTYAPAGYDAAGNTLGYLVEDHQGGRVTQYDIALARFEGYQAASTRASGSGGRQPGTSTQMHDANGHLAGIEDANNAANNRRFVNDANGIALMVDQGGQVQRQLVVNGEVLGRYGVAVTGQDGRGNPSFANLVDMDFGYARITANYPEPAPGAYAVRAGETLESIAQQAYGDRSLWWRIAEANGLASSRELKVGHTLTIPNRVGTVSNHAESFKPYDPSQIKGDTSPTLAPPANDKGCGGVGKLLMVVVAVAVAASTGGALGAALGSIASQAVGLATGTIDTFSWRQVGLSAVSAAVAGALPLPAASGGVQVAVRAAVGNAITQGVGVVTGLQKTFDWRGVAASAVGAGIGQAVGGAIGLNDPGFASRTFGEQFGARLVTGLTAGAATAIARGGKVAIQQVAVDAFGSVIGNSLAEQSTSINKPSSVNYANEMDRASDRYNPAFAQDHRNGADLQSGLLPVLWTPT